MKLEMLNKEKESSTIKSLDIDNSEKIIDEENVKHVKDN
jgi:hypothetical protein